MSWLSWLVASRRASLWVVAVVAALAAASLYHAQRVEQNDDVLEFLPVDNPSVVEFRAAAKRFGGLDVALVGVATDDAFSGQFVERLKRTTKRLNQTEGIDYALTLTSADDYTPDPERGGITTDYLVHHAPATPEERESLARHVMANANVVENLVSRDEKAVLIYCFLRQGVDQRETSGTIRRIVEEELPTEKKYWGGGPFIATYIYDVTRRDLRALAPWACLAIVLFIFASFRDLKGTLLALASTGLGILLTYGVMGAVGARSNIVLGSMPVILVALGSAYPVHFLSRFYVISEGSDPRPALLQALRETAPVNIASAFTTIAGLLSFVTMDIRPLQSFGAFTALGNLFTLAMALTFVPAVAFLLRLRGRPEMSGGLIGRASAAIARLGARRRIVVGVGLAAATLLCALGVGGLDTRMNNRAFFDAGSEPDLADSFMRERFGGSLFVQIVVDGDMTDPLVLRALQELADRIEAVPDVASTTHLGQVLTATNDAMEGVSRLPDTSDKARLLLSFVTGKRAVSQLVNDERDGAMILVKLSTTEIDRVETALSAIQNVAKDANVQRRVLEGGAEIRAKNAERVALRIVAGAKKLDPSASVQLDAVRQALLSPPPGAKHDVLEAELVRFIASEEFTGDLPASPPEAGRTIAKEISHLPADAPLAAITEAVSRALARPADDPAVVDVSESLERPLPEIRGRVAKEGHAAVVVATTGLSDPRAEKFVAGALFDLDLPKALTSDDAGSTAVVPFRTTVTGLPVLYRGLSESVRQNQMSSLVSAVALAALAITLLFRSGWSGLLGITPTLLTVAIVYGAMGLLHIHLDIGTSMLAALVVGSGVDYAVHFMSAWGSAPEGAGPTGQTTPLAEVAGRAAEVTGPGIFTNALMGTAGFFVLTLGESRPMKIVGGLTAAAMLVSALATFLAVPVLARRKRYLGRSKTPVTVDARSSS